MNGTKILAIMRVVLCMFVFAGIAGAQDQANKTTHAADMNSELVRMLTNELRVAPEQAAGGAGAIFALAKSRLNSADFSRVSASIPGMDGLLKATPPAKEEFQVNSNGPMAADWAAPLASLSSSLKSLGLSPAMAGKFVPVLRNYIESRAGSKIAALFSGSVNDLVVCPYDSASSPSKGGNVKTAVLIVGVLFMAAGWSKKKLNSRRACSATRG